MVNPSGESNDGALKLDFDRRLMVQFRGSVVASDAGLLAYRELDDALGLSTMAGERLADARTGKNGRHALVGLLRQSVFGRLAGYEDVNDAERLRHDPTMRWIVGGKAARGAAVRLSTVPEPEARSNSVPGHELPRYHRDVAAAVPPKETFLRTALTAASGHEPNVSGCYAVHFAATYRLPNIGQMGQGCLNN